MKKTISALFVFAFAFLLTACGSTELNVNKTKADKYYGLSYEVPEAFEKIKYEEDFNEEGSSLIFSDYYYSFSKLGSNGKYDDSCSLSFTYDKDHTDYSIEEYADIFNRGKTGTKKTINGVEWLEMRDEFSEKLVDFEYYAKFNGDYYTVRYSDGGSGNLCGEAKETILNSLKLSK